MPGNTLKLSGKVREFYFAEPVGTLAVCCRPSNFSMQSFSFWLRMIVPSQCMTEQPQPKNYITGSQNAQLVLQFYTTCSSHHCKPTQPPILHGMGNESGDAAWLGSKHKMAHSIRW